VKQYSLLKSTATKSLRRFVIALAVSALMVGLFCLAVVIITSGRQSPQPRLASCFMFLALASPFVVGLVIASTVYVRATRMTSTFDSCAGIAMDGLLKAAAAAVVIGALGFAARSPGLRPGDILAFAVILMLFGLRVASICSIGLVAGIPWRIVQAGGSLAVALMCGTVFYANPFLDAAAANLAVHRFLVTLVVSLNPVFVIAGSALNTSLIHNRTLYEHSVLSYYSYSYPSMAGVCALDLTIAAIAGLMVIVNHKLQEKTLCPDSRSSQTARS
jgi:hypothetical protein